MPLCAGRLRVLGPGSIDAGSRLDNRASHIFRFGVWLSV